MIGTVIYTDANFESVDRVLKQFNLGTPTRVYPLKGGIANSNFKVERLGQSPIVLKIWNNRNIDGANVVATQMKYLADHGVRTPAPIAAPDGALTAEVDGLAWMFQPFIEGHWLQPTAAAMANLGEALAVLHQVPVPSDLTVDFQMGLSLMDTVLVAAENDSIVHPFIDRLKGEVPRLRAHLPKDVPRGVIHGDLFCDNLIARGDEIVALLDFEEVACDALILDVAMTFVGCGWQDGRPVRERLTSFLLGYERIRALTDTEQKALPLFMHYATLGIATWRFDQFNIQRPDLNDQDCHQEMVQRIEAYPDLM